MTMNKPTSEPLEPSAVPGGLAASGSTGDVLGSEPIAGLGVAGTSPAGTETSGRVGERAHETAGLVRSRAESGLRSAAESGKTKACGLLDGIASALRRTGEELHEQQGISAAAPYVEKAADRAERFAGYVRSTDVDGMMRDAESAVRREPAIFLGGAFVLGLAVSRLWKAGGTRGEPSYERFGASFDSPHHH